MGEPAVGERCPNERGAGAGYRGAGGRHRQGSRRRPAGADRRRRTGCRRAVSGVLRGTDRERENTGGVRTGGGASFWRGARRDASASPPSRRSTWPPTSGPTPGRSRPSSSTWPPSACSATGSSSTRSLPVNPAAAVRGPKHVVTKGATPVLSPAEARKLLESIDTGALAGLRGPGAALGDALQLRAGERGVGDCGGRTTSGRGAGAG